MVPKNGENLCARYCEEIKDGVDWVYGGCLRDNIFQGVGDGFSTLFRREPWFDGSSIDGLGRLLS